MNQQQHDRRSLDWHRIVIERMRAEPGLLTRSRATVDRWLAQKGHLSNRAYLQAWQVALNGGMEAVAELATAQTQYGDALRQCSPISGLLENSTRWAFRRNWRHENPES